jgi:hypothetical protein
MHAPVAMMIAGAKGVCVKVCLRDGLRFGNAGPTVLLTKGFFFSTGNTLCTRIAHAPTTP